MYSVKPTSMTSDLSTAAHLTTLRWVSSLENGWMPAGPGAGAW